MTTLNLERARSLVTEAEEYFYSHVMYSNYFVPFINAGAKDRAEALYSILLVIAEYRQSLPPESETHKDTFGQYVRASQSLVLGIILDSGASAEEQAECAKIESIESFVVFLDSLELYSKTFWPNVYERLELQQIAVEKQRRSWWRVW